MPRLTANDLESYLREYGWHFHADGDNTWMTGWQGDKRAYPMLIAMTDTWILFQVKPFIKATNDWLTSADFAHFLLELNYDLHMVKLAVDENDDIVLMAQLFTSSMGYDEFSDALGVLGHYAEVLYDKILGRMWDFMPSVKYPTRFLT